MAENATTATAAKPASDDLSPQIIQAMVRKPGDHIKCTRVFGTRYRCNWWCSADAQQYDNPSMRGGQLGTTHKIRKSQFLDVTMTPAGIKIQVITTTEDPA